MLFKFRSQSGALAALVFISGWVLSNSSAQATIYTWNGGNANVSNAANWSPAVPAGPPGAGDIGIISSGSAQLTATMAGPPDELQVHAGGTLYIQNGAALGNHNIVMMGGLFRNQDNRAYNGDFFLHSDSNIGHSSGQLTLSGDVKDYDDDNAGVFNKVNAGLVILSGTGNTYSAGTVVHNGILRAATTGSLGTGGVVVKGGATIHLVATAAQGADVVLESGSGALIQTGSTDSIVAQHGSGLRIDDANYNSNNPIQLDGDVTIRTSAGGVDGSHNYNGVISGAGKLIYNGTANTTRPTSLQAENTYTGGTEVLVGRLRLRSAGRLPDVGTVTIHDGATLQYNAAVTDVIGGLAGDGTLSLAGSSLTLAEGVSPGFSAGMLTVGGAGNVTLGASSVSIFELGSLAGQNDRVTFTGAANLTLGGILQVDNLPGIEIGDYVLFDLNGGTVAGSFTDVLFAGQTNGFVWVNSNNDVMLSITSVIPEPNSLLMLGTFALGLPWLRRRKR